MPKYRVILEFDHPGSGVPTADKSITVSPSGWDYRKILSDDITKMHSVEVYVYEPQWKKIN